MGLTRSDVLESRRRITVDEYHNMIEAGSLGEDDRVQLVAGTVVEEAGGTVVDVVGLGWLTFL